MGYQVGNHCYATKQEAENVYFSSVAPVVQTQTAATTVARPFPFPNTNIPASNTPKLVAPEFRQGKWYLQGNVINAHLPECDPAKNFKDGAEIGWLVFGVMAACYTIVVVKRLIR